MFYKMMSSGHGKAVCPHECTVAAVVHRKKFLMIWPIIISSCLMERFHWPLIQSNYRQLTLFGIEVLFSLIV